MMRAVWNGEVNADAAWYCPRPSPLARRIKGHVAFWNGPRPGLRAWLGGKR